MRGSRRAETSPPAGSPLVLRLLIWAAGLGLAAPLALLLLVHLPPVQHAVLQQLVGRIEQSSGLSVQLGGYHWWPFSRLSLQQVTVRSADKDVLVCDEARLTYRLSANAPYILPEELTLEKPTLHLEKDKAGHWQIPLSRSTEPHKANGGGSVPLWARVPLPSLRLVSGTILGEQAGQQVLVIRNMTGKLGLEVVDGPRLRIRLGDWQGRAELPALGTWQLSGSAELTDGAVALEDVVLTGESGCRISGEGAWSVAPPYDGEIRVKVDRLTAAAIPALEELWIRQLNGEATVKRSDGAWTVTHAVTTDRGAFQGVLTVSQEGNPEARWTGDLSELRLPLPVSVPESRLAGHFEIGVQGKSIHELQAEVKGQLTPCGWGDIAIQKGEIEATFAQGTLRVARGRAESSLGSYTLTGQADLEGLWNPTHAGEAKAELVFERASLDKLTTRAPQQRVGGRIAAEGRYGSGDFGRLDRWSAKGEANLQIPEFGSLKASGSTRDQGVDLTYELDIADSQKIAALWPDWQGKGRLASSGTIQGKFGDLTWEGKLSAPQFQWAGIEAEQAVVTGKGKLTGKEGTRKLSFHARSCTVEGQRIANPSLDLDQQGKECRYQFKGAELYGLDTAQLSGRLAPLFDGPRTLTIEQGQLAARGFTGAVSGHIELAGDTIRVSALQVQQAQQKLLLSGLVSTGGQSDLKLTCENLAAGPVLRVLGVDEGASGTVSGQVRLSGPAGQPEASVQLRMVNGSLDLKALVAGPKASNKGPQPASREAIERLELKGSYARQSLQLEGELVSSAFPTPVQLQMKLPLALSLKPFRCELQPAGPWDSSVRVAELRAERLLPWINVLDQLSGRFQGDIQGSGTLKQPVIKASGTLHDGLFRVRAWPHLVEKVEAEWEADARRLVVRKSQMQVFGAQVSVQGSAEYPGFDVFDFEATGEGLDYPEFYGVKGKVSGRVRIVQNEKGTKLTGDLTLSKATMDLGDFENELARNIEVIEADTKGNVLEIRGDERDQKSFYNRMSMELAIGLPPSGTWVRGKGLDAEIGGELRIAKAPFGPPKLFGGFKALRGTYTFQGRKLKIVQGELVLQGLTKPEPLLKIVCQKEVRDAVIQVQVVGPANQPKLTMSSIPAMNQVDVLSYLLFDHPAGDLTAKQSHQLQDNAASWLGSQTSQVLKQALGDSRLAPDTIQYRSSQEKETGGIVEIGKYVTPDLYVNYGKGVNGETGNQVRVEYRLNRHLSVQTEVGGTEKSGVDVFWRYDFGK